MVREIHAFDDIEDEVRESGSRMPPDFENVTYDEPFKNVFSIKRILAVVIKETIDLYSECSVDNIVSLIESVAPGITAKQSDGKITISESYVKGEGTVKFDLLVKVGVPAGKIAIMGCKYVQVKINLEMQRDPTPGYPLSYRGLYYGSRLISDQIPKIDYNTDYRILMPVYSIWITLVGPTTAVANKVLRYKLKDMNDNLERGSDSFISRMNTVTDLLNIYFICIDKSILASKFVKDGMESVVEYVSLLFAGQFNDSRLEKHDERFVEVIEKYGEELGNMAEYYLRVEDMVAESKALGKVMGKIELLSENGYLDEEIIEVFIHAKNNPITREDAARFLADYYVNCSV